MVIVERKYVGRILVFLAVTMALVWYVTSKRNDFNQAAFPASPKAKPVSATVTPVQPRLLERDFFSEYRMERDRVRAQQLEILQGLASNAKADNVSRQEAGKKIVSLTENLTREMEIEGLLKAKGYEDVLVFLHSSAAEVVVKTQVEIGQADMAAISDIIKRSTSLKPDRVSIIARP